MVLIIFCTSLFICIAKKDALNGAGVCRTFTICKYSQYNNWRKMLGDSLVPTRVSKSLNHTATGMNLRFFFIWGFSCSSSLVVVCRLQAKGEDPPDIVSLKFSWWDLEPIHKDKLDNWQENGQEWGFAGTISTLKKADNEKVPWGLFFVSNIHTHARCLGHWACVAGT